MHIAVAVVVGIIIVISSSSSINCKWVYTHWQCATIQYNNTHHTE